MANYHTMEFSLSQIRLESTTSPEYVKVQAPLPPPASDNSSAQSQRISEGAIAGIVIGLIAAVALILATFFWYSRIKRKLHRSTMPVPPDPDKGIYSKDGVFYREMSADNLGQPGRMVPPQELYTPGVASFFHPPVEMPADSKSLSG
ncbi:hypothetical protein ABW19_dt0204322 [Dactylella cylindrospora]|nr:hypothetical protein ABW19_dt0204322 [Dactylella cylindrospora]